MLASRGPNGARTITLATALWTTVSLAAIGVASRPALGQEPATCFGLEATIVGDEGSDRLVGTLGDDVIMGLGGNDEILGRAGDDVICGGDGADGLIGHSGDDRIDGGAGNDGVFGTAGADQLFGGEGDDVMTGAPEDGVNSAGGRPPSRAFPSPSR